MQQYTPIIYINDKAIIISLQFYRNKYEILTFAVLISKGLHTKKATPIK